MGREEKMEQKEEREGKYKGVNNKQKGTQITNDPKCKKAQKN